jgi:hypothetical protein
MLERSYVPCSGPGQSLLDSFPAFFFVSVVSGLFACRQQCVVHFVSVVPVPPNLFFWRFPLLVALLSIIKHSCASLLTELVGCTFNL